MGKVYVAEYHHIRSGRGPMFRSVKDFRADLQLYYSMGFRPVLASEYLENKMPLPSGASPIILTFDDSNPSQIQLRKNGTVDPKCAVGIWMDFAKKHPDFPVHGTFFVLPDSLWGKRKQAAAKVKILRDLGSELANHTITHPFLNRCSDAKVKWEVATCNQKLEKLGQEGPYSLAVPYGEFPRHRGILEGFQWKGKHISFSGVFMAWGGPARSPNDPKFKKYKIPRMMAVNEPDSIKSFIHGIKRGHNKPYVEP
jgi:peptidoglycan/xylan/chitin deacetylase (PgdA/CDA1 family)